MAVKINPPPHLKIPRKFLQDNEVFPYLKNMETILFQLWSRVGGDTDSITEIINEQAANNLTLISDLDRRLNDGPDFTIDTTGFTTDTTYITTDKVKA